MRATLSLLLAVLCLAAPAHAGQETDDRLAIRAVIQAQMAAFKRDDGPAAYAHAAPSIRKMYDTPEAFMRMVRRGYAAVYRPRSVEFQPPAFEGDRAMQPVLVTGPDGVSYIALYEMERQADRRWKIAGVVLIASPDEAI